MPQYLFWKPRTAFKCKFCSLQLLMMLQEVTLELLGETSSLFDSFCSATSVPLFPVRSYCSKIISTAKLLHNFFGLLPGFFTAVLTKIRGCKYWPSISVKDYEVGTKKDQSTLKALSSNFCLFGIAPFILFSKRFQTI